MKGESKQWRCQQCGRRTILKYEKYEMYERMYEIIPSIKVKTLFVCYFMPLQTSLRQNKYFRLTYKTYFH